MIGKLLLFAFVNMGKPDPPAVARAKHIAGEVKAAAELTNLILPPATPERKDGP